MCVKLQRAFVRAFVRRSKIKFLKTLFPVKYSVKFLTKLIILVVPMLESKDFNKNLRILVLADVLKV